MTITHVKKILCSALLAVSSIASAHTMDFSYNGDLSNPQGYGFKKNQIYDIGIALDSPIIKGKKVVKLSVPVFNDENISKATVWLSKTLDATKDNESLFTPDLTSYDVTIKNGILDFIFPEPFEIPDDGVYLGYSLTITGLDADQLSTPVAVVEGHTPGGLWFHATQSQKRWVDLSKRDNLVSPMMVTLEGEFPANAFTMSTSQAELVLGENETGELEVVLTNWGSNGITSFDYDYAIGEVKKSGTFKVTNPAPSILGANTYAILCVTPPKERGKYTYQLTATKVNNAENELGETSLILPLTLQAFVPIYRPLVEEYTGLTCGWCPRGYVMLEQMKQQYGDQFVALSYHSTSQEKGAMCCIKPEDFPMIINSYPSATLNRGAVIDPFDIPDLWNVSMTGSTSVDIETNLSWVDKDNTRLIAKSRARFLNDIHESDYLFSVALLADNLTNEQWIQSNAYNSYEAIGQYSGPFWDLFVGKDSHVAGLIYNDVVVYYQDIKGIEGSLPQEIEAEKWYEYEFEIDTSKLVNLSGEQFINDFNKMRTVAMIVDKNTGIPVNCISSIYPDNTDCNMIEENEWSAPIIVKTEYYDLQGRKVTNLDKGIYIRCEQLSDGSKKTIKIIK